MLVTAALVLGGLTGPMTPAAVEASSSASHAAVASGQCKPVWFIGARGSGESQSKTTDGMGPEIYSMYSTVSAYLKREGLTTAPVAVDYAAASVNVLAPDAAVRGLLAQGDLPDAFPELWPGRRGPGLHHYGAGDLQAASAPAYGLGSRGPSGGVA
jgi:hypothetical protein